LTDDNATSRVIHCSIEKCEEENFETFDSPTTCTDNVGKIIKSSNDFYLCIDNSSSVKVGSGVNPSYHTVTTEEAIINIYKVRNDGSAILLQENSLPICDVTSGSRSCVNNQPTQYCQKIDDNGILKIYETISNSCAPIAGSSPTEIFYFDNDYQKLIQAPTNSDPNIMAYQCNYDSTNSNTLISCNIVKGYIIGQSLIHCNGWKGDGCTVETIPTGSGCTDNNEVGNLISINTMCFGETAFTLETDLKNIAFELNALNPIYGSFPGDIIILSISTTHILVTSLAGNLCFFFSFFLFI